MNSLTDLIWCASYRGLTVRCSIEDFQDIHTALFTHWTGIENIFSCFAWIQFIHRVESDLKVEKYLSFSVERIWWDQNSRRSSLRLREKCNWIVYSKKACETEEKNSSSPLPISCLFSKSTFGRGSRIVPLGTINSSRMGNLVFNTWTSFGEKPENSNGKELIFRYFTPFPLGKCENIEPFSKRNISWISIFDRDIRPLRAVKRRISWGTNKSGSEIDSGLFLERKCRNSFWWIRSNSRKKRGFKCRKSFPRDFQSINSSLVSMLSDFSLQFLWKKMLGMKPGVGVSIELTACWKIRSKIRNPEFAAKVG